MGYNLGPYIFQHKFVSSNEHNMQICQLLTLEVNKDKDLYSDFPKKLYFTF
jgi:hypothetical protein